jgi:hypothetical protein
MKLQKDITFVPDFIKMEPGTKYGTAAGKLYGINLVDSANKRIFCRFL